jgi:formate hydrogenlyase subunit 3/multisubunit Na+/H+ antiporter MnhD subunit
MEAWPKYIILLGVALFIIGLTYYFFGNHLHWIGNLPGDIHIEKDNFSFYFPITTMILFSIIINVLYKLWIHFFN